MTVPASLFLLDLLLLCSFLRSVDVTAPPVLTIVQDVVRSPDND